MTTRAAFPNLSGLGAWHGGEGGEEGMVLGKGQACVRPPLTPMGLQAPAPAARMSQAAHTYRPATHVAWLQLGHGPQPTDWGSLHQMVEKIPKTLSVAIWWSSECLQFRSFRPGSYFLV